MSQRRLILLCLLVTPVVMFCINLLYSGSPVDQQNGFQIITLIISAPIIFLNAWEWQQPESLDNLIPPNFKSSVSSPIQIDLVGKIVLSIISVVVFAWMGLVVFGAIGRAAETVPTQVAGTVLDISSIQTAAVETALAEIEQKPAPDGTPQITPSPGGTEISAGTLEPLQTATAEPDTIILVPIQTDTPSADVATEIPDLITLAGAGNEVVDFQKWDGPAIVQVVYSGTGSFVVTKNSAPDGQSEVFINKTGAYIGTLPIDFLATEYTSQFEITAVGPWKIQVIRLANARTETIPATITGSGDDVIVLTGGTPDLLTIDASLATGTFAIHGFRAGIWDLLSKETSPYTGIVQAAAGTVALQISATGTWSVAMTIK